MYLFKDVSDVDFEDFGFWSHNYEPAPLKIYSDLI